MSDPDDTDAVDGATEPAEDGATTTAEDGDGDTVAIREPPTVLVPVRVMEGQTLSASLVEFLAPARVVVLGYHVLPEQTPTEQAGLQFEDRARTAVDDVAAVFTEAEHETHAGGSVETRVVFTHDRDQTIERVAAEVEATAVLLPNPAGEIDDLLVALRGAVDTRRLADLVGTLAGEGIDVTLLGYESDAFDAAGEVDRARRRLLDRGLPATRLAIETGTSEAPVRDIVERSAEFDAIVVGEGGRTLFSQIVGDDADRVAAGAVAPVLVVRNPPVDEV